MEHTGSGREAEGQKPRGRRAAGISARSVPVQFVAEAGSQQLFGVRRVAAEEEEKSG